MIALDIVQLDDGSTGMIMEGCSEHCSIRWFGRADHKCAWWKEGEKGLRAIDNLAAFLTDNLRHPASTQGHNPYSDYLTR